MGKNDNNAAAVKQDNKPVAKTKAKKGPNWFKRRWVNIKEVVSELKKVSWPSFAKTMSQLGVVLVVVVIFLVLISLSDWGLSALLELIRPQA